MFPCREQNQPAGIKWDQHEAFWGLCQGDHQCPLAGHPCSVQPLCSLVRGQPAALELHLVRCTQGMASTQILSPSPHFRKPQLLEPWDYQGLLLWGSQNQYIFSCCCCRRHHKNSTRVHSQPERKQKDIELLFSKSSNCFST